MMSISICIYLYDLSNSNVRYPIKILLFPLCILQRCYMYFIALPIHVRMCMFPLKEERFKTKNVIHVF